MSFSSKTTLSRRAMFKASAAAIAAPAILGTIGSGAARAAAPASGKQAPGVYRYKVGEFEVTVVTDGGRTIPLSDTLVKNATKDQVNSALEAAFMEKDKFPLFFNPVVVNTGKKLVAIDTGNGPAAFEQSKGAVGQYHANLSAAGIDAGAIDAVVISHFHPDHVGGLVTADNKPAFANAEIMVPTPEWDFWMDDGNMSRAPEAMKGVFANARRVFGAYNNKVTKYEPGKDVADGIQTVATHGHTPGHTSQIITSGNKSVVVQGDVTSLPALFARNPGWHLMFDMDGAMAEKARRALYDRIVADRLIVQGYHYSFPSAAYVEKDGNGYRPNPVPWNPVL